MKGATSVAHTEQDLDPHHLPSVSIFALIICLPSFYLSLFWKDSPWQWPGRHSYPTDIFLPTVAFPCLLVLSSLLSPGGSDHSFLQPNKSLKILRILLSHSQIQLIPQHHCPNLHPLLLAPYHWCHSRGDPSLSLAGQGYNEIEGLLQTQGRKQVSEEMDWV